VNLTTNLQLGPRFNSTVESPPVADIWMVRKPKAEASKERKRPDGREHDWLKVMKMHTNIHTQRGITVLK
jgi:hypothetical protein